MAKRLGRLKRRAGQIGESELWIIVPLMLLVLAGAFLRRAYKISIEYGYKMFSLQTLQELTPYFLIAGLVLGAPALPWIARQVRGLKKRERQR